MTSENNQPLVDTSSPQPETVNTRTDGTTVTDPIDPIGTVAPVEAHTHSDTPTISTDNTDSSATVETEDNAPVYEPFDVETRKLDKMMNNPSVKGIWAANKEAKEEKKRLPKPKQKWGLVEVACAFLIFLLTQIAFSIVLLFIAISHVKDIEADAITSQLTDEVTKLALSPASIIVSSVTMYASWLIMMWYSSRFRGEKSWAKDFGLKFKKWDWAIGLGLAALGFGLVQGISALLSAMGVDMDAAGNTDTFTEQSSFAWKAFMFIGLVSILGPCMEELFFRGFVMRAILRAAQKGESYDPSGPIGYFFANKMPLLYSMYFAVARFFYKIRYVAAAVISSAVFGLMHLQGIEAVNFVTVALTGLLGLMFATVALKTQRIGPTMIAHMGYNGIIAVITLTMGS